MFNKHTWHGWVSTTFALIVYYEYNYGTQTWEKQQQHTLRGKAGGMLMSECTCTWKKHTGLIYETAT